MCKEDLLIEHENDAPISVKELLPVYDVYRVGATENVYLIPKDEYADYRNPIFYIEEDLGDEALKAPKAIVTTIPNDQSVGSSYRNIRSMCVFKKDNNIAKDAPHLTAEAETEMLSYLKYVKCK